MSTELDAARTRWARDCPGKCDLCGNRDEGAILYPGVIIHGQPVGYVCDTCIPHEQDPWGSWKWEAVTEGPTYPEVLLNQRGRFLDTIGRLTGQPDVVRDNLEEAICMLKEIVNPHDCTCCRKDNERVKAFVEKCRNPQS